MHISSQVYPGFPRFTEGRPSTPLLRMQLSQYCILGSAQPTSMNSPIIFCISISGKLSLVSAYQTGPGTEKGYIHPVEMVRF